MTLEEIERLASAALASRPAPTTNAAPIVELARFVIAAVPVVRDAMSLYDRAETCVDRPWMGCAMDHSDISCALGEAIDALRAAMEKS